MSTEAAGGPAPTGAAGGTKQPLDEVMLAMDVVDTLRRRERMVKRELDAGGREDDLKERLRTIYRAQGIDVSDHVIEEGVAALKDQRFVYKPPPDSLGVKLARLYVSRRKWRKWVIAAVAAPILIWLGYYFAVVAPNAKLPQKIEAVHAQVMEIAKSDEAREQAAGLFTTAESDLRDENPAGAREALESLGNMRTTLEQQYTLRIVNRPGERSGVWRVPDVNTGARNYYIIVEAVDPSGEVLKVPIKNQETGKTERVTKWGLRVDEKTYNAVARDKQDDGIIENDRFGRKPRGFLKPTYEMPTTGGAITQW
ncbi:MAG: DUF6384 family protein [Chromatiaceae bacterium]